MSMKAHKGTFIGTKADLCRCWRRKPKTPCEHSELFTGTYESDAGNFPIRISAESPRVATMKTLGNPTSQHFNRINQQLLSLHISVLLQGTCDPPSKAHLR